MTAKVILHGIDELVIQTGLTLPEIYTHSDLRTEVCRRLDVAGTKRIFSECNLGLHAWQIPIPEGDIRMHPQGNRRYVAHAYIAPRCLHEDPASAYAAAYRALDAVRRSFAAPDHCRINELELIALKSIALHADIVGWHYSQATASRILHPGGAVPRGNTRHGIVTGSTFSRSFSIYNKTVEIKVDPSGVWIKDHWPDEALAPEAGPVWRVEARAHSRKDILAVVADINSFWNGILSRFRLVRCPGPQAPVNRRRWNVDPVWRRLQELRFTAPWTDAPGLPFSRRATTEHVRNAMVGRLLRLVAGVGGIDGLDAEFPDIAAAIVRRAMTERPWLRDDMLLWAARRR